MQKTPIILAKPPAERAKAGAGPGAGPPPPAAGPAPPIVLMKAREEGRGGAGGEGPALAPPRAEPRPTQPVYQLHNRGLPAPPGTLDPVAGQARLAAPEKMKTSIKLVDEQMNWCDSAIEFLLDQTDVLVVGVLGLQGTGKSTLMSLLAANQPEEDQRAFVFRPQSPEMKERGGNQTCGIDFFITQERVVFLDTQPILSPSILDHLINNDRKLPPEYSLPHTYVEMQSLQIAAFLFTVCHVVLVVQDWFTDLSLYRFLQTAEMVKPSTPSPSHEPSGAAGPDEAAEYYPHLVFLQNKARAEAFCPRRLRQMHLVLDRLMAHSHLKYKGALSMLDCGLFPGLPADFLEAEVNLFLLPLLEAEGEDAPPPRRSRGGAALPPAPPLPGPRRLRDPPGSAPRAGAGGRPGPALAHAAHREELVPLRRPHLGRGEEVVGVGRVQPAAGLSGRNPPGTAQTAPKPHGTTPKWPRNRPNRPKTAPELPKPTRNCPNRPKTAWNDPKKAPELPKPTRNCPNCPKTARNDPKTAPELPKPTQNHMERPQNGPGTAQTAQNSME
ncbi:nonsense-mediated mRNA decay factor SMG9-like [Apteryx mantelli]|uniref:Nonsense-mediated mRNA decay factor SMG9 n=1 Tax=Apteryx mantelli TaxID=2696672 RepID=A0ABM4G737_9AVES